VYHTPVTVVADGLPMKKGVWGTRKSKNMNHLSYLLPMLPIYYLEYIIYMFKDIKGYLRVF
jgi:hypothetical protein